MLLVSKHGCRCKSRLYPASVVVSRGKLPPFDQLFLFLHKLKLRTLQINSESPSPLKTSCTWLSGHNQFGCKKHDSTLYATQFQKPISRNTHCNWLHWNCSAGAVQFSFKVWTVLFIQVTDNSEMLDRQIREQSLCRFYIR